MIRNVLVYTSTQALNRRFSRFYSGVINNKCLPLLGMEKSTKLK